MPYEHDLKINHNDVRCLAAQVLIDDQLANCWGFDGFPAISVEADGDTFNLSIALDEFSAGPIALSRRDAATQVRRLKTGKPLDEQLRADLVEMAQRLEQVSRIKF